MQPKQLLAVTSTQNNTGTKEAYFPNIRHNAVRCYAFVVKMQPIDQNNDNYNAAAN
jgi:hypothetical protein